MSVFWELADRQIESSFHSVRNNVLILDMKSFHSCFHPVGPTGYSSGPETVSSSTQTPLMLYNFSNLFVFLSLMDNGFIPFLDTPTEHFKAF